MTAFHDYEPLPLIPHGFPPSAQDAWRLVRELHAQRRISSMEALSIFGGLFLHGNDVEVSRLAASSPPRQGG